MTIAFIVAIDDEAHREECRKHAWLLSEAYEQLALRNCQLFQAREESAYERNLVSVLTERLDERDADYKRLAGMHQAQAETIRELAQLAADRLGMIRSKNQRIAGLENIAFPGLEQAAKYEAQNRRDT